MNINDVGRRAHQLLRGFGLFQSMSDARGARASKSAWRAHLFQYPYRYSGILKCNDDSDPHFVGCRYPGNYYKYGSQVVRLLIWFFMGFGRVAYIIGLRFIICLIQKLSYIRKLH